MTAPPKVIAFAVVLAGLTGSPVWARHHHRPRTLRMEATAYAQDSKPTASGTIAHEGIVAADPAVLPFGTRIRVKSAGAYDGTYTVTDTGAKIRGASHRYLCTDSGRSETVRPEGSDGRDTGKRFR
jgi:3D (Asp-Asp-Asp) domain-containing protein